MTALAVALVALSAALLGALVAALAWYRGAVSRCERIDAERDLLVRERDALTVTASTLTAERDRERGLREAAEVQRNDAMARARRRLTSEGMTNEQITAALADVFGALRVLPQAATGGAESAADRDDLISPWLQPSGPAGGD